MKKILVIISLVSFLSPISVLALSFDGVNDRVALGAAPATLNITGSQITNSAWVYLNTAVGGDSIIRKNIVHYGLSFQVTPNRFRFEISTNTTCDSIANAASVTAPVAKRWYFVAATYDGANIKMYVNGVLEATTAKTGNLANSLCGLTGQTTDFNIGNYFRNSADAEMFDGRIDDARVYNRALSAGEIRMLYYGSPSRSGLVGYWPLIGNTSGTFEPDFSGLKNHGTRTGGPVRGALSPTSRWRR